jgi:purine-nucleoside phosphorylase
MHNLMNYTAPEKQLRDAILFLRKRLHVIPSTAIVLGSGLGYFADQLSPEIVLENTEIPHFPQPTVAGHGGKFILGTIDGTRTIAIQGRSHYYEGRSFTEITFYVQVLARLRVKNLILTNAAGGINPALKPGNLVLLNDFINFTQLELISKEQLPESLFSPALAEIAKSTARAQHITLHKGCYCWTTGPSYETHAEVAAMHRLGVDVVGMSTVPEILVAAALNMNILAISLVTNLAAGIRTAPLSHAEVQAAADEIKKPYSNFMRALISNISRSET